jgi:hypothetical protein
MFANKPVTLRCQIGQGGFSNERVVRIQTASDGTFVGVAHPNYCRTAAGAPLKPGQPGRGEKIDGLVMARTLQQQEGGTLLVSVPDGSVLAVGEDVLGPPVPTE